MAISVLLRSRSFIFFGVNVNMLMAKGLLEALEQRENTTTTVQEINEDYDSGEIVKIFSENIEEPKYILRDNTGKEFTFSFDD